MRTRNLTRRPLLRFRRGGEALDQSSEAEQPRPAAAWIRESAAMVLPALVALALAFGAWEAWIEIKDVKPYLVPAPSAVVARLWDDPAFFAKEGLKTLEAAMLGFVGGTAVALGLASFSVEVDWPLTKQGLDSLLAVELKHRIESDLGVSVPVAKLLQGVDIDQLATFILSQVMLTDAPLATRHDLRPPRIEGPVDNRIDNFDGENAEELSARLGRLPEAELDSLLSNLLAQDEAG